MSWSHSSESRTARRLAKSLGILSRANRYDRDRNRPMKAEQQRIGDTVTKERSISASTEVDAPVERVWETLCDTRRYPEWIENTLEVTQEDGPALLGGRYEELTKIAGPWKARTQWRIAEFEPLRRQVHEGNGVPTARNMTVIIDVKPLDEGTMVTLTIRYTPRFGILGTAIDRMTEGSIRRAQERSVQALHLLAG